MNKIFLYCLVFITANYLSAMKFNPINKDCYIERNYEVLNNYNNFSVYIKSKIVDVIDNFYEKYVKKDLHNERYMTRLLLFLVNMAHEYNIVDDILENIEKNNEQEIIIYAKEIYLKFSKNNNELIQNAYTAFDDKISIEELNKLSLNNSYGIDVVYKNNNMINHHLVDMIFFKIIKNNCDLEITSPSLGITLPASIWFKLIILDQQVKILLYKEKFIYKPYFPSVVIETLFDDNNHSNCSNIEKINKLLSGLFLFNKSDFDIIKNAFKFIKNIEDFKNFNKKDHFFLFRYIAYKYDDKKKYTMLNYFTENIISKNYVDFYNDNFGFSSLVNELNLNVNDYSAEKIENIKNNIINQHKKRMYEILSKKYFYNKEVSDNIARIEYDNFLFESEIVNNYNKIIIDFNKKNKDILTVDKILKIKSNFNESFKKKIFDITEILKNNLNNKQIGIYNKFNNIYFDYNEFKNIEIFDYNYEMTDFYKKIRNRLFANEIVKLIIIKSIKFNFINDNSTEQDVINLIKERTNFLLNSNSKNMFDNEIIYLNNIVDIKYKSKSKNLIGIDVFIFNEFLREFYLKIFYISPENKYNFSTKSNKLDIELRFDEWLLLFETLSKKAIFNELAVQNIFDKIVEKFKDIKAYIKYNNENPFFDNYLAGKNNQSLRKKLFVYYLYNENKELIDNIKNENNEEIIRNKFNNFLSKINYANKILINNKEQEELKEQDKAIIDEYLEELLGKTSHISFASNKKNNKKTQAKKKTKVKPDKKTENKKELEPEATKNNKDKQKTTKTNKNNKNPQNQTGGFIADIPLHNNTKKTKKALTKGKILVQEAEAENKKEVEPNATKSNKNKKNQQEQTGGSVAESPGVGLREVFEATPSPPENSKVFLPKASNKVLPKREILVREAEVEPEAEPSTDLSKYKYLSKKVIVPQINSQFGALQYKLDKKYEDKQEKVGKNDVVSLPNSNEKPVAIKQKTELSPVQNIEKEESIVSEEKKEMSKRKIRKAEIKRMKIKEDRAERKKIAINAINNQKSLKASKDNWEKEQQNRELASKNNYEKLLLELENRNRVIEKALLKNDFKVVALKKKLEDELERNKVSINQIRKKINDKTLNLKEAEKSVSIYSIENYEKPVVIQQKTELSPVQNIEKEKPKAVQKRKENNNKVRNFFDTTKNIAKDAISAASATKKVVLGDFAYVANFLSQRQINRIQTENKKFIDNFSKDKEKYTEMIKEISKNYCNNIFALDEFINILINEKHNEDINYFNIKLSEVDLYIKNISLNQNNKNVNNLVEQICNNFKYLNEHEANFIQLIYSSSHYQNLVYSFMQVDGNISEQDFSKLLLWGTAHIKQKTLLSDRVLAYKNKRNMYYGYIISSYERLREILKQE